MLLLVVVGSAVTTLWAPNTMPPVNNNMAKQRHFMQVERRTGDEAFTQTWSAVDWIRWQREDPMNFNAFHPLFTRNKANTHVVCE